MIFFKKESVIIQVGTKIATYQSRIVKF